MNAIVLLSGGMDSTTVLWKYLTEGHSVHPMTFNYGQTHGHEVEAALDVVKDAVQRFGEQMLDPINVDLSIIGATLFSGTSLVGDPSGVPKGEDGPNPSTIVPARNLVFLSLAVAAACSRGCEEVAYAPHAWDHGLYPDCRPKFAGRMADVAKFAHTSPIKIACPFISTPKNAVVLAGEHYGVPWGLTWSCYRSHDMHCGDCEACLDRKKAFAMAEVQDPTQYL